MKPLIDRITKATNIRLKHRPTGSEEREANAEFIVEAFTVAHETGMTPRQMAEKLKSAEDAFKRLLDTIVGFGLADKHAPVRCDLEKLGAILDPARFSPPQGAVFAPPANPEPVLPPGLPPLPPGTRYGGQLKDYEGKVSGYVCMDEHDQWSRYRLAWSGVKERPEEREANWHIATPFDS